MSWQIDLMDGGWGTVLMIIMIVIWAVGSFYYGDGLSMIGIGSINDDISNDGWTSVTRARYLSEKKGRESSRRALRAIKPDAKFRDSKLDDLIEQR